MEAATTAFLAVVVVGVAAGSAVTTVDHGAHAPSSLPSPCRFKVVEMHPKLERVEMLRFLFPSCMTEEKMY